MSIRSVSGQLRRAACAVLLAGAPLTAAAAQGGPPTGTRPASTQPPGEVRRGGRAMEEQVQRRVMAIMRERLALTDEQLGQLEQMTRQFEGDRQSVRGEDYRVRMTLRRELARGDSASQERIAEALDRMPAVERRRTDLMEREQKELARFLSPAQRARYFALQEEIRRGMDLIVDKRDTPDGPQRRGGRPPDSRDRGRP